MGNQADSARLADQVRSAGRAAGLDAVGITSAEVFAGARRVIEERKARGLDGGMQFTYRNPARSTDPSQVLAGARSVVVGARAYLRSPPGDAGTRRAPPPAAGPTARIARYAWVDHYAPLRQALGAVAARLRRDGWKAVVVADDNALVDRAAAYRAGLGWYGRNTTILLPGAGSWFLLGSVVTDAALPAAPAPVADGCGTCRRCITACPTGALDVPGELDARRCLAWLLQAPGVFPARYRVAVGDRLYGCDDCQEVCPVNRLGERRRPPPPAEVGARPGAAALDVLASSDEALLEAWGRWYIPGRDPAHLRRNALLVLANAGQPGSAVVHGAVERALRHPHPIVRGHAVWAARRLGFPHLLSIVAGDPDPAVAAEIDPRQPVPARGPRRAADPGVPGCQ